MSFYVFGFVELRENGFREDFAKLNAHLIERVYTPDDALYENLVLIKGNQCTKSRRCQQRKDDAVAGPVSLKYFAFHKRLTCVRSELLPHFLLSLSEGQCFRLGEEVAEKDAVMFRVRDWVVRCCRCYEVCRYQFGTLVY